MLAQASRHPGLLEELTEFCQNPERPVYGSCAGMILMADVDGVAGGKKPQKGLGAIPGMNVWRNLYGSKWLDKVSIASEIDRVSSRPTGQF